MAKQVKKSQTSEVLRYMKQYKFITDEKAHEKFGVNRLGGIIFNLRKRGVQIDTVMVESTNRYGTLVRYGRYYYRGESK